FKCPGVVTVDEVEVPNPEVEKELRIPTTLSLHIDLNANMPLSEIGDSPVSGLLKIKFDAISRKLFSAVGKVKIDFAGRPQQPIDQWKINTFLDLGFKLKELANLVEVLKGSPYAVWAPLHVLNGSAEFKIKGKLNLKKRRGEVPIEFQTRFYSAQQKINTDGKGKLKFDFSEINKGLGFKLDLLLDQLQLALPTFHLGPIPNFLPDNRFKKPGEEEKPPKKELPFKYLVTVKTGQDGVLLSNLSKNGKIPFALNLRLTEERAGGTVTVKQTPVEFFKRVATIKNFEVELDEPIDKSRLEGVIGVSYAAYDIRILVIGSVKRPRYIFESDPPLDREQIISVLIYGRTFEDLNQSEADTVNSVSSAAADRALTLGSMFLLASTPIESVSYNPNTNQVTARLRVAKGTSIDLGTQEGKTQNIGLRQRIGGNWFINTYLENDSETGEQSGGATLEWSKRY
ncbi:MAG: translocation/assembly module TamB domain-containing protein, partial [bacterium]|nr:translocation/assembly module TamB domain-containing protein [bacterium]